MQGLVYWFTFNDRLKNQTPPYYYIGSKLEGDFVNGVILDSRGKPYWSSCKQERFKKALAFEKPIVKILHVCDDPLDEEEKYHSHYRVVKSDLFFNKASAKGTWKSSLKGVSKSPEHKLKMKLSSALKGVEPWNHPNSVKNKTHLVWAKSEIFFNWYFGEHSHSRLGPKIMSKETGIECSHITGISVINKFKSGWNPYLDLNFQAFKNALDETS